MAEENDPTLSIKICWVVVILITIISIMFYIKSDYHPLIAFISPSVIAIISLLIAWLSEKRMVIISRSDLIGIVRDLERSRFNFFNKLHRFEKEIEVEKDKKKIERLLYEGIQILEIAAWESLQCLRQAFLLKKWAKQDDKNSFANGIYILVDNIFLFRHINIVTNRHVRYLLLCCQELVKIGITDDWTSKLISLLKKNGVSEIRTNDKNFVGFLERVLKEIEIDPSGKIPREKYMGMPFKNIK